MALTKKRDIFTELANKYKLNRNVISVICNHPFIFAKKVMADRDDEKSIMFHYFGKFKIKRRFKGKKREIMDGADRKRLERLRAAGYDVEKYKEYIDE